MQIGGRSGIGTVKNAFAVVTAVLLHKSGLPEIGPRLAMAQKLPQPQADVLWQTQDGAAKFIFTLQAHGANLGEEYSRFVAQGTEYTALPKIKPATWETVSGCVKTFMSRLGVPGYTIDLRVPIDVSDPTLPVDTCRFGCGASEKTLRQVNIFTLN